jgi:leucyl-tRNA synthetase
MKPYDHKKIEKKWQKTWDEQQVYKTLDAKKAIAKKLKPYYVLDMFPYPSGAGLHVGHPRGYIASDVFARMKRMHGYNVLHPMGFDSFGLPAEQYAIQTGKHPGPFTDTLVKRYKQQLTMLGFSYDWNRQVATHDPEYYKWTQWIFLQIYNSWFDMDKQKARPIDDLMAIFEKSGNSKVHAACDHDVQIFSAKEWKSFSQLEQQNILMKYRLAYQGYAEVNWCEELGTVLANDEVIDGPNGPVSERGGFPVVKKQMRQWFMRITAYADRLLSGLETIDWSHSIKEIQRNWIGKSEGSEINFAITGSDQVITVFTTRADTLYGVTYVVLTPEHELIGQLQSQIENWDEVQKYIDEVKSKSDDDRTSAKEKTGVQLQGIFVVNPANNEQIPVWVADYVLPGYGTGAVMAVPAHDERDFEFVKKYHLKIKEVICPDTNTFMGSGAFLKTSEGKYLFQRRTQDAPTSAGKIVTFGGGKELSEEPLVCLIRELQEELELSIREKDISKKIVFQDHKGWHIFFVVENVIVESLILHEGESIEVFDSLEDALSHKDFCPEQKKAILQLMHSNQFCFTEIGTVHNSSQFDGLTSEKAKKAITEFVGGKLVTKYKMRDAIFARQRYWGEPIPLVHKKDGMITLVKEKQLPLELPKVKSYTPSGNGEGPLATVKSWVDAGYETNTMPGWAGSSWYFLRYIDAHNKKAFASENERDYWFGKNGGVDMYVGGQEHATGHLLYSRFWHKVLHDLGYVHTDEPFKKLRNQGMILAEDGRKMSKRWGNVINPDDVVAQFGADTMRVYEMFMGPFEASQPWSTDGMVGARRFIERIWRFQEKLLDTKVTTSEYQDFEKVLHKTIKKVTDDIAEFSFNTAVSAMMILANEAEKHPQIYKDDFKKFLQILAPFAPHMTEELWRTLGEKDSVHISSWPVYDSEKIIDDTVTLGVQINGKVRAQIQIAIDAPESQVQERVLLLPEVLKWLEGKKIKKFIYIPKKIISIVVS